MFHDKGLTSDQYVHGVAMKKKALTDQALYLMKSASVDCRVHATSDEEESSCFSLPQNLPEDAMYRTLSFHDDLDDRRYARRVSKLIVVQRDGNKFYMEKESGNLYDYDKLKKDNELVLVGKV